MTSRSVSAFFLTIYLCLAGVLGESSVTDWTPYERGSLGVYPQVQFRTTETTAPLVHITKWNTSCDAGYVFISPHGDHVLDNKIYMLDEQGQLIWHHEERGSIQNAQVQQYKGSNFITYWVGDDSFYGHGAGYYKMIDHTYNIAHVLTPANGLSGDYHDFIITHNNTALITSYLKTPWDLSAKNRSNGFIWDCIFQELDIETGDLVFEWRASEHFTFTDMTVDSWSSWTGTSEDPWDYFHLNSVTKDVYGSYLIAARYTNAVSYIDGRNGHAIWHLGGRLNSFYDFSEGNATKFVDPHMARWNGAGSITLFDNIDFWTLGQDQQASRGVKIALNYDKLVAKATTIFSHPDNVFARSEGSIDKLENGNYLVGYGTTAIYSDFSPDGTLLCDAHFAPLHTEGSTHATSEAVQTYRIHKSRWVGHPKQPLRVVVDGDAMFVSWNGATEVKTWAVEGRGGDSGKKTHGYSMIGRFEHWGFETTVPLTQRKDFDQFLVTALDVKGKRLGVWFVGKDGNLQELLIYAPRHDHLHFEDAITYALVLFAIMALLLLATQKNSLVSLLRYGRRRRRRSSYFQEKDAKAGKA